MDLSLFLRVVWSRKWLMAAGLVLATVLAFLSLVRIDIHSSNHFRYRQSQQWASYTTLFVTQHGFPWGTLGTTTGVGQPDQTHATDPSRFISLALIYSQLIPSDAVRQIMIKNGGPINGTIQAAALTDPSNTSDALPLVSIAGLASTPGGATKLVQRASAAFLAYLSAEQSAAGTSPADRVVRAGDQPAGAREAAPGSLDHAADRRLLHDGAGDDRALLHPREPAPPRAGDDG